MLDKRSIYPGMIVRLLDQEHMRLFAAEYPRIADNLMDCAGRQARVVETMPFKAVLLIELEPKTYLEFHCSYELIAEIVSPQITRDQITQILKEA